MLRFAWTAIASFSALPLKLSLAGGLILTALGVGYTGWVLYDRLILQATVPGWSSLVCLQLLFSGATLTAVGLVGDYVARIYEEIKCRPLYVLSEAVNLGQNLNLPARAVYLTPPQPPATRNGHHHPAEPLPILESARHSCS
jgi:dolichol-phosphate mannosyltransferase